MKQNRHQKIAELVSRYEIETQEELAEKLKEAGFTHYTVFKNRKPEFIPIP